MKRLPGLVVALAFAVGPILAQSRLVAPDTGGYLRWGSLRVRPGLELTGLGYDNNILRSSDVATERVGDYTGTVSPKADLLTLLGQSAFLTFRQRFDYTMYANHFDENYLNDLTTARVTVPFTTRFGAFAQGLYSITHDRPPDLERARPKQERVSFSSGLILEPGWRTQIEIAAAWDDYGYEESNIDPAVTNFIAQRLNRVESGTSLDLRYRVLTRTRVVLQGLYKGIDFEHPITFENPPSDPQTIERDTTEWRAMSGLEFGGRAPLTGLFLVGWNRITPDDPRIERLSIPIGQVRLQYAFTSRLRLQGNADRFSGFSVFGANSYYLRSEVELRGLYQIGRPVMLELAAARGRLTFPASLNLLEREDDLERYEALVRLRQSQDSRGKRVEYNVSARQVRSRSTVPSLDLSYLWVSFGAVFGY